jgi:hypothetical protein
MPIAGPIRQLRGNPHFLNVALVTVFCVVPVMVYYFNAKQSDSEKEQLSVRGWRCRVFCL